MRNHEKSWRIMNNCLTDRVCRNSFFRTLILTLARHPTLWATPNPNPQIVNHKLSLPQTIRSPSCVLWCPLFAPFGVPFLRPLAFTNACGLRVLVWIDTSHTYIHTYIHSTQSLWRRGVSTDSVPRGWSDGECIEVVTRRTVYRGGDPTDTERGHGVTDSAAVLKL